MTNIICRRTLLSQLLNSDSLALSSIFLFPLIMTYFTYENIAWWLKLNPLSTGLFSSSFIQSSLQKYLTVRKKIKRSIPKQVQKVGGMEKWPRNWKDTISYHSIFVWTEVVQCCTAFRTCWVFMGDTKLVSDHFWCQGWS